MNKTSRTVGVVLRLTVAFGIIAYLLSRKEMDLSHFIAVVGGTLAHWPWLAAGLILFFLCMWAGIFRWRLILNAQGIRLPLKRIFSIFFIGHFFNAFMMGATGGDVVKALYVSEETHHKKTEAISTVIADRIVGMAALFLLAFIMIVVRAPLFISHKATHPFCLLMLILIAATMLALVLIFNQNIFERYPLFRRLEQRFAFGPLIRKLYDSFYLCRTCPALLTQTFLLSIANHLLTVTACWCLGRSLQIPNALLDYLTFFPMILAIASLPITPGGLGVREGAAVTLLSAVGIPNSQALPLSLLSYMALLAWSLFGGAIFLFYSTGGGRAIRAEFREIEDEIHEGGPEDVEEAIPVAATPGLPETHTQLDLFSPAAASQDPGPGPAGPDHAPP
jgi:glycosyltransferase 2 family protein